MSRAGARPVVVLLAAVALTTGCSPQPDRPSPEPDVTAATTAATTATAYPDEAMSQGELDAALSAQPTGPPRTTQEALEQLWLSYGLEEPPPAVAAVRTVTREEADAVHRACMAEQGFPSSVDQLGQEGISFDQAQQDDLHRASYVCVAMYPMDERYLKPFSVEQLRVLYDWMVTETIPCMRADGVQPPEPPSFEAYVERYGRTGYERWSPHQEVQAPPGHDELGLQTWCPDEPPDEVLYGP